MKWSVSSTDVFQAGQRRADDLTTDQVYEFIAATTPMSAVVAERLFLDLVTTNHANFGVYKFTASASD